MKKNHLLNYWYWKLLKSCDRFGLLKYCGRFGFFQYCGRFSFLFLSSIVTVLWSFLFKYCNRIWPFFKVLWPVRSFKVLWPVRSCIIYWKKNNNNQAFILKNNSKELYLLALAHGIYLLLRLMNYMINGSFN